MPDAITNTSPLLFLHCAGALDLLPRIFHRVLVPGAGAEEIRTGARLGHDVPRIEGLGWAVQRSPAQTPSEWFAPDLGPGERAAMALALEERTAVLLLDDRLARRTAQAAGLTVWGTFKVLLEAKKRGFLPGLAPVIQRLKESGMWLSDEAQRQILELAGEA